MTKMLNLTAKNQMNLNKIKGEAITENLQKKLKSNTENLISNSIFTSKYAVSALIKSA